MGDTLSVELYSFNKNSHITTYVEDDIFEVTNRVQENFEGNMQGLDQEGTLTRYSQFDEGDKKAYLLVPPQNQPPPPSDDVNFYRLITDNGSTLDLQVYTFNKTTQAINLVGDDVLQVTERNGENFRGVMQSMGKEGALNRNAYYDDGAIKGYVFGTGGGGGGGGDDKVFYRTNQVVTANMQPLTLREFVVSSQTGAITYNGDKMFFVMEIEGQNYKGYMITGAAGGLQQMANLPKLVRSPQYDEGDERGYVLVEEDDDEHRKEPSDKVKFGRKVSDVNNVVTFEMYEYDLTNQQERALNQTVYFRWTEEILQQYKGKMVDSPNVASLAQGADTEFAVRVPNFDANGQLAYVIIEPSLGRPPDDHQPPPPLPPTGSLNPQEIIEAVEDALQVARGQLKQNYPTKMGVIDTISNLYNERELQQTFGAIGVTGNKRAILQAISQALTTQLNYRI
jgi:hypothetical protein